VVHAIAAIGWPILDRIHIAGDFAISPHGIGIAVGFLLGAWVLSKEGPKRGVTVEHVNTMVFWALVGAIVGARLFYVIAHFSEFDGFLDMLAIWRGGISLLGGIAGAVLVNIPIMRKYGYRFFQVMDGAVIGLAFGIAVGRIGDLVIGDHLGKPTGWVLAWQYRGGTLPGPWVRQGSTWVAAGLAGGQTEELSRQGARLFGPGGALTSSGVGVHQTALYDLVGAFLLFLLLFWLSRTPRRLGILTLTFGGWYGIERLVTDFLRIDKRFFGLTGSQWTASTVAAVSIITLVLWGLASRRLPRGTRTYGPGRSEPASLE